MANKYPDIQPGDVFQRLTVLGSAPKQGIYLNWKVRCACGCEKVVADRHLKNGGTISCGCIARERSSESVSTHKQSKTKEYRIWYHIKERCFNPNCKAYKNYGGRGITMHDGWVSDFAAFFKYVGTIDHGLEIDRINNNGNYEPNNVRIVERIVNANNRRGNRHIEFKGELRTLAEWSRMTGIKQGTIWWRMNQGWPTEKILRPTNQHVGCWNAAIHAMQEGLSGEVTA
jgi:hypothetical protein